MKTPKGWEASDNIADEEEENAPFKLRIAISYTKLVVSTLLRSHTHEVKIIHALE